MPDPVRASWILEADERCEHCGQTYAVELEVRCAACDGPLCPFCVVQVRQSLRSPEPRCPEGSCREDE